MRHYRGPSKKPDKYVGLERCGDDRATRLRCVEVADNDVKDGSKFRFTTTFGGKDKNKCGGDTPLCKQDWQAWAYTVTLPPDYDGVQPLKTSCIAGEPPQGFDHAEGGWACPAVKIPSSFTSDDPFLSKCDPTGKWYWTCAELQLDERNVGEFQQVHRCGESEDDPSPETTEVSDAFSPYGPLVHR